MATASNRLCRALLGVMAAGLLAAGLSGCGTGGDNSAPVAQTAPPGTQADSTPNAVEPAPKVEARFVQPFAQAVLTDEIPDGQQLPPDRTLAGKPTAPLRIAVEKLWPRIKLTDGQGNARPFVAAVDTDAGRVEITLHPEWAPNHVRNFAALAKTGYYDGLCFDRVVHQQSQAADGGQQRLDLIKAGCPLGTGEEGLGHIGYFLKPEFSPTVRHEEGTVGFWHDDNPATACCRFYITLGPAPLLDGEFTVVGKVTRGMEVVREIAGRPVLDPQAYPERERPAHPVIIKSVSVTPDPVD